MFAHCTTLLEYDDPPAVVLLRALAPRITRGLRRVCAASPSCSTSGRHTSWLLLRPGRMTSGRVRGGRPGGGSTSLRRPLRYDAGPPAAGGHGPPASCPC